VDKQGVRIHSGLHVPELCMDWLTFLFYQSKQQQQQTIIRHL